MDPASIMNFSVWVFVGGLGFLVAFQMLTGTINTRGMLNDKRSGRFSPERLQLLVFTLAGAGYYVQLAAEQENTLEMPPVPDELLILVGASHSLYLGGKTFSMLRGLLGRV